MSEFVEVRTSELVGPALDWAVAKCSGMTLFTMGEDWPGNYNVTVLAGEAPILILDLVNRMWREHQGVTVPWSPSTNWAHGGPLRDKYKVDITEGDHAVSASILTESCECADVSGPTALIALCRAIVAAKLGNVVQVPAELVVVIA